MHLNSAYGRNIILFSANQNPWSQSMVHFPLKIRSCEDFGLVGQTNNV